MQCKHKQRGRFMVTRFARPTALVSIVCLSVAVTFQLAALRAAGMNGTPPPEPRERGRFLMFHATGIIRRSSLLAAGLLLLVPAPAYAAGGHGGPPLVFAALLWIGHLVGGVLGAIGRAPL